MVLASFGRIAVLVLAGVLLRLVLITTNSPPEGILGMTAGLVVITQIIKR
jgi:hypothetical protein